MKKPFTLLIILWAALAEAQTVIHGPIVQNPAAQTTTGHVIYWTDTHDPVVLETCNGNVSEVTPGGVLQSTINGVAQQNARIRRDFSLTGLSGPCGFKLKNGANLEIDVGGTVKPFKAAGESIRFGVIGDQGDQGTAQTNLAAQMAARNLDLYLTTGDNVYDDINYKNNRQLWPVFIQWLNAATRPLHRVTPVFPSLGNHDLHLLLAGAMAVPGDGGSRFVFESGDALFVVVLTAGSTTNAAYAQWIDQQFSASTKTFKFLIGHYPGLRECGNFNDTYSQWITQYWEPVVDKHKAIFFTGHHHHYSVWWPDGDVGGKYVITGGGAGASTPFSSTCPNPQPTFKQQVAHFMDVEISNKILTMRAIGVAGQQYGPTLTLNRSGQEPPPDPPPPPEEEFGIYLASQGFSNQQGPRWQYLDGPGGAPMTFDAANNRWRGAEAFSLVGSNWQHPGANVDSVRRFVVPGTGPARITNPVCRPDKNGNGVRAQIKHNSSVIFDQVLAPTACAPVDIELPAVKLGETIDFIVNDNSTASTGNQYDSTTWDPQVEVIQPPPPPPPPPPDVDVRIEPGKIQSWQMKGIGDSFKLSQSRPLPKPFPTVEALSFQGNGAGNGASQWTVDPLNQGSITPLFTGTGTLCHRRDGSVYTKYTYYQSGNTAEIAYPRSGSFLNYEGPRNLNAASPYVTFRGSASGWWGLDITGWVYFLHASGRIGSAHGPQTVVENGKIYCDEKKYLGTNDKPLKMPIDFALAPESQFRQFIADTGNGRIAELNIQHSAKGTDSSLSTLIDGFKNIYSIDILGVKLYVADAGAGNIQECDIALKTCRVIAQAFDPKWLRIDSKGLIVYLSNSAATLYELNIATGVTRQIARLHSSIDAGPAWKWCYLDKKGHLGSVDGIRCTASQTTPGTLNFISRDGTQNFIYSNGGPRNSGPMFVQGYGNAVRDSAQHYGWAIEGSENEAAFVVTGFGSTGISRYRRKRATDPQKFNSTAWNNGKNTFQWGNDQVPSPALFCGSYGFNRLGLTCNFDQMVDWPEEELDKFIRSGFGLTKWITPTDQQIKDMKYFIRKESYKGHIQEIPY